MKRVAIIGAGAAGCFCAAELSSRLPDCRVEVFEAASRPMAKLALTGGGRCNLTNTFGGMSGFPAPPCTVTYSSLSIPSAAHEADLSAVYPRGARLMKRLLYAFDQNDCCRWFQGAGVRLVVQKDHCIFPESQDAMQIVRTLERLMRQGGVVLKCRSKVEAITPERQLVFSSGEREQFDAVVVTTGGNSSSILASCCLNIEKEVPSLFTFKINDSALRALMGTVVDKVCLSIPGTNLRSSGTLLLTDWGLSGPATLKLSSYAARYLAENQYKSAILINWTGSDEEDAALLIDSFISEYPRKSLGASHPEAFSSRLWKMLLNRAGLEENRRWSKISGKVRKKLISTLTADSYEIAGRARFKEEFVTCGGVSLGEINPSTLECRHIGGLYLAGEVLDIDGVTGGFNLQAAWSSAYCVATAVGKALASGQ